jgi:hypothetical protein
MGVTYLMVYVPAYHTNRAVIARAAKQSVSIGTVPPGSQILVADIVKFEAKAKTVVI